MENPRKSGFTLIELLVVITIISMLAGQLLPALSTARERGRQANCINNLRQIGIAIEIYFQDYKDYPPWLSVLNPSYLPPKEIFVCLTDLARGEMGHGNPDFPDTLDITSDPADIPEYYRVAPAGDFLYRNTDITACSYSYEFNPNRCEWFEDTQSETTIAQADRNNDGMVTWKEAKLWQARNTPYGSKVPITRCFWHYYNHDQKVLNLAYSDYHVFTSGDEWEISSY